MPVLLYPLALLALAALPTALAIYLLRNRFKPTLVSSIVLWEHLTRPKGGGIRVQRLYLPLLFFLEIAVLALLALAAADPHLPRKSVERLLVAVLDDSASMAARGGKGAARSRGLRALKAEVKSCRANAVRVIVAGTKPLVLDLPAEPGAALGRLDGWKCRAPRAALDAALAMALERAGSHGRVVVITDHTPAEDVMNNRVRWIGCGEPVANAAIVEASRTAAGETDRCMAGVANYGTGPLTIAATLSWPDCVTSPVRHLEIAPGEVKRFTFAVPGSARVATISLPDDALAEDNRADLLHPVEKKVSVDIAVGNQVLAHALRSAVESSGLSSPMPVWPRLVIADETGSFASADAWIVRCRTTAKPVVFTGPFAIDSDHPLSDGLTIEEVTWAADTNAIPGTPVIAAGNTILVGERALPGGARELFLNIVPEKSTVQRAPAWPVLVWNLLHWRAESGPGPRATNVRAGDDVSVNVGRAVRAAKVKGPDGHSTERAPRGGVLSFCADEPGGYTVNDGSASYSLSAQFLSPEESDLRRCATGAWGAPQADVVAPRAFASCAVWLALAGLAVAFLHLVLAVRGKGGS